MLHNVKPDFPVPAATTGHTARASCPHLLKLAPQPSQVPLQGSRLRARALQCLRLLLELPLQARHLCAQRVCLACGQPGVYHAAARCAPNPGTPRCQRLAEGGR